MLSQLKAVGIRDILGVKCFHATQPLSDLQPSCCALALWQWRQLFPSVTACLHCHEQGEAGETDVASLPDKTKIASELHALCLYRELKMQQI